MSVDVGPLSPDVFAPGKRQQNLKKALITDQVLNMGTAEGAIGPENNYDTDRLVSVMVYVMSNMPRYITYNFACLIMTYELRVNLPLYGVYRHGLMGGSPYEPTIPLEVCKIP